jgi:two-component system nitrogen regulation sensor histidine kinase NtrY
MSLRARIIVYLVVLHAALGAAAFAAFRGRPIFLLGAEVAIVASAVAAAMLVHAFLLPLRMVRTGAELIREQDFTARFRRTGGREIDELVGLYNRMIDRLREERLRVEEQRSFLERVIAASPGGILTLDFDGRLSSANPAAEKLLGTRMEPAMGRPLREIESPLASALASLPAGRPEIVGVQGRRRLRCIRGEFYDRGFPRTFFLVEELTDELRASEKAAYEKLIRMITHEVNNSVGAVRSLLESAAHLSAGLEGEDRKDLGRALEVAVARMNHLNVFMRGFADVVRLPAPDLRPASLKALVDDILLLMAPDMAARGIECVWSRADEVGDVRMDRNQIEQVLVNVLKNAAEAIGDGGRILLDLGLDGGRTCLTVSDTGPGIPADVRDRLFTPFFSTKKDGRGLGLTVIREILTQHGFDFGLQNRPEGGAEFRMRC